MKLSQTQVAAMSEIERSISGRIVFGAGFGRYRVALRGLMHRLPGLVTSDLTARNQERFALTDAGREALRSQAKG